MEKVMPQDQETRKTLTLIPIPFQHKVTVMFGEEIKFDDLISEHESTFGTLKKYSSSSSPSSPSSSSSSHHDKLEGKEQQDKGRTYPLLSPKDDDFHKNWDSTEQEKQLYHKITLRIEERLEILNEKLKYNLSMDRRI